MGVWREGACVCGGRGSVCVEGGGVCVWREGACVCGGRRYNELAPYNVIRVNHNNHILILM